MHLDVLIETATNKTARRYTLGEHLEPAKMMRDDVFIQEAVGRAEMMLTSARAHLFEVIGDLWATLVEGKEPAPAQVARFITLHTYVVGVCVDVVQLVFKAAGGTAVYQKGPLDRCLRDVLTMNQHVVGTHANLRDGRASVAWHGAAEVAVLVFIWSTLPRWVSLRATHHTRYRPFRAESPCAASLIPRRNRRAVCAHSPRSRARYLTLCAVAVLTVGCGRAHRGTHLVQSC